MTIISGGNLEAYEDYIENEVSNVFIWHKVEVTCFSQSFCKNVHALQ